MRKYIIIAAAAIVAMASCTKTTLDDEAALGHKISFQVANYAAQTKAMTTTELDGAFSSYAWYTNADPTTMAFMIGETISWDGTKKEWAPSRDYYWPKTGYVDFFSYDGTKNPTTVPTRNATTGEVTLAYASQTITSTDNILVADAAYHQTQNKSTYHIDDASVTGVPTLFRHQLAKVKFNVQVATTKTASAHTSWKVNVLNTGTTLSNVVVANKGSLSLANIYNSNETERWTNTNTSNPNVGWVAETGTETISVDHTPEMVMAINATSSGTAVALIDERTVMPQVLGTTVKFTLTYRVRAYMDSSTDPYIDEVRTVTAQNLSALVTSITEWDMNKIITYNVVIDPVGERVLFDPAVEEWDNSTTGSFTITQ